MTAALPPVVGLPRLCSGRSMRPWGRCSQVSRKGLPQLVVCKSGDAAPESGRNSETAPLTAAVQDAVEDLEPATLPGLEIPENAAASEEKQVAEIQGVEIVEGDERPNMYIPEGYVSAARTSVIVLLGATFTIAAFRIVRNFLSPRATRKRTVNKNRELIDELLAYLPNKRQELTSQVAWMLKMKMGYSSTEIFRKYLWYLLREGGFGQDSVDDLVYLKGVLKMTDEDVAEALKERASRIYDKFGTLMLNTEGMSAQGVERKAAGQALFSKMLYLTECAQLVSADSKAARAADLREIFGATEEDVNKLRIEVLEEVDLDSLERMVSEDSEDIEGSADDESDQ